MFTQAFRSKTFFKQLIYPRVAGRWLLYATALFSLFACSHFVSYELSHRQSFSSLQCTFAAKRQLYETTILLGEMPREVILTVTDFRHNVVVEQAKLNVDDEDGYWVIQHNTSSDSVETEREHRIRQKDLAYERSYEIKMGGAPPLIGSDRSKCRRI